MSTGYDGGRDDGALIPKRAKRRAPGTPAAVVWERVERRRWTDDQHRRVAERAAQTITPNQAKVLNALTDEPKRVCDIARETDLKNWQVADAIRRLAAKHLADRALGGRWIGW